MKIACDEFFNKLEILLSILEHHIYLLSFYHRSKIRRIWKRSIVISRLAILLRILEIPAMVYDGLRWFQVHQNWRKMPHFIASSGRALKPTSHRMIVKDYRSMTGKDQEIK